MSPRLQPAIGYVRVSTDEQGQSGLGLEAQREAIRRHCERRGLHLVEIHEDIASGADRDRPGLAAAVEAVRKLRRRGAVLVIMRPDRLARDVEVSGRVQRLTGGRIHSVEAGGELPAMVLDMQSSMAKDERRLIGERTSAALARKRERGERVGADPEVLREAGQRGAATTKARAQEFAEGVRWAFEGMVADLSLRAAAELLNERDVRTPSGYPREGARWSPEMVRRTRRRLGL